MHFCTRRFCDSPEPSALLYCFYIYGIFWCLSISGIAHTKFTFLLSPSPPPLWILPGAHALHLDSRAYSRVVNNSHNRETFVVYFSLLLLLLCLLYSLLSHRSLVSLMERKFDNLITVGLYIVDFVYRDDNLGTEIMEFWLYKSLTEIDVLEFIYTVGNSFIYNFIYFYLALSL